MDLKPCPFCGGKAKQVDICATDFSSANAGGSYIICQSCLACSAVMFGEKAGLSELWNRRALPPEPRTCEHDWWTVSDADWVIRGARCHKCGEFIAGTVKQLAGELKPRTCETCATGCLPNERVYVNPDVETPCPGWTPRSPQSADVEMVREVREAIEEAKRRAKEVNGYSAIDKMDEALAALDRLAGKEE